LIFKTKRKTALQQAVMIRSYGIRFCFLSIVTIEKHNRWNRNVHLLRKLMLCFCTSSWKNPMS